MKRRKDLRWFRRLEFKLSSITMVRLNRFEDIESNCIVDIFVLRTQAKNLVEFMASFKQKYFIKASISSSNFIVLYPAERLHLFLRCTVRPSHSQFQ